MDLRSLGDEKLRPPDHEATEALATLLGRVQQISIAVTENLADDRHMCSTGPSTAQLEKHKLELARALRSLHTLVAAGMVAAEWASPSVRYSVHSAAGRRSDRVQLYHDDYTRDRHWDALVFEQEWVKQYVDHHPACEPVALMTSSGMAAFNTILHYVCNTVTRGPVLMGSGCYHECAQLIETSTLADLVVKVEDTDTAEWVRAVESLRPEAIFVDSLCNSLSMALPDIDAILCKLTECDLQSYVVIDNTGLTIGYQPWDRPTIPVGLIVFESLTKCAQFGLDGTPAGMIVTSESHAHKLDSLREHLGTNVTHMAVGQIPLPNRHLFERRIARLGRNCERLARKTDIFLRSRGIPAKVISPVLPGHPSVSVARRYAFRGPIFGISLARRADSHAARRSLVDAVIDEARRRRVPLIEGTSFGFDTTRIYLTAPDDAKGAPFVRIAPGTEHSDGIERVADVLVAALDLVLGPSQPAPTGTTAS